MDTISHLQIETKGRYGKIVLNRPEVHNALSLEMIDGLRSAIQEFNRDTKIRAICIYGRGENFSSGADLNYMKEQSDMSMEENYMDAVNLAGLFHDISKSELPVITLAGGRIMGGAIGIVAASDIAIVEDNALFRFSETLLGLVPATISPYIVRRTGKSRALELMITARAFTAMEAERFGLVNKVVEKGSLGDALEEYMKMIGKTAPNAARETKKLLVKLDENPDTQEEQSLTAKVIANARASEEGQEGLAAFFDKRKPKWIQ